jgi:GPH family glycoside/pentoside/hexuronide:cation symporter
MLGWSFASAGYVANVRQSAETLADMRITVALVPLIFLGLSCVAMIANPLGRKRPRLGSQLECPADPVALG